MESDQINTMKSDQTNTMESDQINTMKSDQTNTMESDQINTVDSDQTNTMESDQINTIKSDQINTMESDQTNTMESDQINEFPGKSQLKMKTKDDDEWFKKADELEKQILEKKVSIQDFFKLRDEAFGHLKSTKSKPAPIEKKENKIKKRTSTDVASKRLIKELTPVRRSSRIKARKTDKIIDEKQKFDIWNRKQIPYNFSLEAEESFIGFNNTDVENHPYFPFFTPSDRKRKFLEGDDDYQAKAKRRRMSSSRTTAVPVLEITDITDAMLKNLATRASSKIRDSEKGTSCHQCRQKTLDTKTVCRSGRCIGVRGQFDAVCLLNRYGERAIDALFDENWECPPCRGMCNCSICRTQQGLQPTGILAPLAEAKGYLSVHEYLQKELRQKTGIFGKKHFADNDFIDDN